MAKDKAQASGEANPEMHLRVLRNAEDKKLAEKVYDTYIHREEKGYERFAEWLISFDRLLASFGGQPQIKENDDDVIDDDLDSDFDDELDSDFDEEASTKLSSSIASSLK